VLHCVTLENPEAVVHEAAKRILHLVATAQEAKRDFHFVLSGGTTPKRLYRILADANISWDHVHFFWGDERCVHLDHTDSNYKMAHDTFLSKINVSASHVHRLQGEIAPPLSAHNYEKTIQAIVGLSHFVGHDKQCPYTGIPSFDLVLLGMGADGHTASLFPETEALKAKTWVVANFVPKLSGYRLTLTPILLNQAANIFFLVTGSDKAKILQAVLEGPKNTDLLPSQLIHGETGNVTWIIDKAASACLGMIHDKQRT